MEIIFATHNKGKLTEVKNIFQGTDVSILSLDDLNYADEIEETGNTFEENALIKAKAIYETFGSPIIADDSGLNVEQLNGEPGIYSARFAGDNCTYDDNNKKIISVLKKYPEPHFAKFVCCAVFLSNENQFVEYGFLEGKIIGTPAGKNGFGYDPIFIPNENGSIKTLAEYTLEEKNVISHRKRAFQKLHERLQQKNIL